MCDGGVGRAAEEQEAHEGPFQPNAVEGDAEVELPELPTGDHADQAPDLRVQRSAAAGEQAGPTHGLGLTRRGGGRGEHHGAVRQ